MGRFNVDNILFPDLKWENELEQRAIELRKILQTCKPDFVYHPVDNGIKRLSFIWPRHYWRDLAAYPLSVPVFDEIGRAALGRWYTWHFSM